jgi:sugar lactone lactonase YvrE
MTSLDQRPAGLALPDSEALFKEAKRRERRRRLLWLGVGVIMVGAVAATIAASGSHPESAPHDAVISASRASKAAGLPVGAVVSLEHAGPLAVSPSGALYVVDQRRDQVLVRLANGRFRVAAGDGKEGFTGDGGPATKAELSSVSDIAFAPNGNLYVADGSRVRIVERDGVIHTVAGDGDSVSPVANGTQALSAPIGPAIFIAVSPSGELYIATSAQLLRLTSDGYLDTVQADVTSGPRQGPLNEFGQIAIDAQGNIYASSLFTGWSVYRIAPNGMATDLGYARRSGGDTADMELGSGGLVEADNGSSILRIEGDRLVTSYAFTKARSINGFSFLDYFAVAPNGVIYADDVGPPAFERFQQLVSVAHGHGHSLWRGPARK